MKKKAYCTTTQIFYELNYVKLNTHFCISLSTCKETSEKILTSGFSEKFVFAFLFFACWFVFWLLGFAFAICLGLYLSVCFLFFLCVCFYFFLCFIFIICFGRFCLFFCHSAKTHDLEGLGSQGRGQA